MSEKSVGGDLSNGNHLRASRSDDPSSLFELRRGKLKTDDRDPKSEDRSQMSEDGSRMTMGRVKLIYSNFILRWHLLAP